MSASLSDPTDAMLVCTPQPDDGPDEPTIGRGFEVSVSGTYKVQPNKGPAITKFFAAGNIYPHRIRKIFANPTPPGACYIHY